MALEQLLERAEHHLAVARARHAPPHLTQRGVLRRERTLRELVPEQPHQRAQALERLARLVHRASRMLPVDVPFEQLEREIQLAEGDPPEAVCGTLAGQQRELAQALALRAQATLALRLRKRRSRPHEGA